jgi:hypothetical protein
MVERIRDLEELRIKVEREIRRRVVPTVEEITELPALVDLVVDHVREAADPEGWNDSDVSMGVAAVIADALNLLGRKATAKRG